MKKLKNYKHIFKKPKVSPKAFIAGGVKLIGEISIGDYSSIWYNTVIRADINKIEIGSHTNIQDGCILHVSDDLGVEIADYVSVGHGAILHACTIGKATLIGSGAIVLNRARIKEESVDAAGSLVPPNFVAPSRSLIKGHPAKVVRKVTKKEIEKNLWWAAKYRKLVEKYKKQYTEVS